MQAIRIHQVGTFEQLKYEEIDTPVPDKDDVLVKVISASVNFADIMVRKGLYPMMPPLPAIPGIDCSGIVESVGENVSQFHPGQYVAALGRGCYADYMTTNAFTVFPISEDIDMDEAAAIPVNYLTAYHMLHTMARGYDQIINYKVEDVVQRVKEITGGKGADIILNSVAGNTFGRDFEMLAPLGQIIWLGMAAGLPEGNLTELLGMGFIRSAGIRTFMLPSIFDLDPTLMARSSEILFNYLADGKIKPHIFERIQLSEAARAHKLLESGTVQGKLILKP